MANPDSKRCRLQKEIKRLELQYALMIIVLYGTIGIAIALLSLSGYAIFQIGFNFATYQERVPVGLQHYKRKEHDSAVNPSEIQPRTHCACLFDSTVDAVSFAMTWNYVSGIASWIQFSLVRHSVLND